MSLFRDANRPAVSTGAERPKRPFRGPNSVAPQGASAQTVNYRAHANARIEVPPEQAHHWAARKAALLRDLPISMLEAR
ncbi:hypothetical protein DWV00_03180 [Trinickia dinghuensis]|uniref:Uncharacterized protein n=1 Tax=Trinickia dinghuensis TaxID=2291023 RepID=A0A3D8K787_9BURK|nr:hypothetical protein DWV00_03180 [Trinickia dinghuensis]